MVEGSANGEFGVAWLLLLIAGWDDELLATLSEHLPRVIDHLTPEGRLPTEQEASRLA